MWLWLLALSWDQHKCLPPYLTHTARIWLWQSLILSCGSGKKWPSLVRLYWKFWWHPLKWAYVVYVIVSLCAVFGVTLFLPFKGCKSTSCASCRSVLENSFLLFVKSSRKWITLSESTGKVKLLLVKFTKFWGRQNVCFRHSNTLNTYRLRSGWTYFLNVENLFSKCIIMILLWTIYLCICFLFVCLLSSSDDICWTGSFSPLKGPLTIECKLAFRCASIQSTTDGKDQALHYFLFKSETLNLFHSNIHYNTK